ncbi:MAG TPA: rhodanese-like domain-containing protein [Anaeromyxobacteraceae bacterium]|nr:rhodanese-like domain-containing protein [Anaeromyxobacteraceae bacterium]
MDPWIVAAGAGVALVAARHVLDRKPPPDVVRQRLAAGATVVDVRTPGEFARGAYRGAVNIPLQTLGGRVGEIPKDRPVVLYCASGNRSAHAARILAQAGYPDVVNAGGLRDMPA